MYRPPPPPQKKVAIIMRWLCYWGSHKAGFHCAEEGWRLYKLLKIHSCNHFHPFLQQPEKTADISTGHNWFPCEMMSGNEDKNSILVTFLYPDLGSRSDWLKVCFNQSKSTTRSGYLHVISTEFLHLFHRHHFVMKPVMASQNVAHLSRLLSNYSTLFSWKPKLSAYM